ncbi:MAG: FAD-dependent oxidoreductase, partial [Chloroflexota bacterium]
NNPEKDEYNHWENFVDRSAEVAREANVNFETLSAAEVRAKSPKILITDDEHAGFEPTGGHVMIEKAIAVQLDLARQLGAKTLLESPVIDIQSDESGVVVSTAEGNYLGAKAIVSTGAWINDFMPERLEQNFRVTRQIVFWFEVDDPEEYGPEQLPGILWVGRRLEDYFAAFTLPPGSKPGLKVLTEQYVDATSPQAVTRDISQDEIDDFYQKFGETKIAGLNKNCLKASVCLYTHTPDDHFVIDYHPTLHNVMIVSACSSHGFKHSAAIGESLVQQLFEGESKISLAPFALARLER